ncbi:hypothetical protein [Undibacterium sp.]|jgi:hypothetical protein|uniref:hypothetical protein n=1 Tax=Undibacterium sp. TaxID=1914977 RepID=UPI002CC39E32|nr:hypothetical protein [Undibacterium sp.]HTD05886.1 hypothetical protein [Undibacterium sp.]
MDRMRQIFASWKFIEWFLVVATLVLVLSATASTWYYSHILGKYVSAKPEDWGAFGSYIGGLLGPAVSFVALMAVIVTVSLQRAAIEGQRLQFLDIHALQLKATQLQQQQLALSEGAAAHEKVFAYKLAILKMIEQQVTRFIYEVDEMDRSEREQIAPFNPRSEEYRNLYRHYRDKRNPVKEKIEKLNEFSMQFTMNQHNTIGVVQCEGVPVLTPRH